MELVSTLLQWIFDISYISCFPLIVLADGQRLKMVAITKLMTWFTILRVRKKFPNQGQDIQPCQRKQWGQVIFEVLMGQNQEDRILTVVLCESGCTTKKVALWESCWWLYN